MTTIQQRRRSQRESKKNKGRLDEPVFVEKEESNYEEEAVAPPTLQKLFGESSSVSKLLDFLTLYRRFDYSLTEISQNSGVPWRTLHRIWPVLERYGIVKLTREVGRAKLFTLNKDSEIAKLLTTLSLKIAAYDRERSGDPLKELPGRTLPPEEALAEVESAFVRVKRSNRG